MPPWGAVKGFGEFSNDTSLTPEEIELIVRWTEGGVPEGDDKDFPSQVDVEPTPKVATRGRLALADDLRLKRPFILGALRPTKVSAGASFQITAELPDGSIEPLLWLKDYRQPFSHPFVLRSPLKLPAGTLIRGVPRGNMVMLVPSPTGTKK